MLKNAIFIFLICCISLNCFADRIYVLNGNGYNSAGDELIDAITANGHTVVVDQLGLTLPPNFTTTCNDPIDGYDWLCLFGNTDYTAITPQIQNYLDEGGKVFMQYEVTCCDDATNSVASILSDVTGLAITPNVNTSIAATGLSTLPGWEAVDLNCCATIVGNAYRGLDGLPLNNQYQATATVNGIPTIDNCLNFGFTFNTNNFVGTANNGAIMGFGDYNLWYDADEPFANGGSTPINMDIVDFVFPNENSTCFAFPPGCIDSPINNASSFDISLGNDTTLCGNDTLTLNALTSGATYIWQDGSTDSFYQVDTAGLYWVQVNGGCGSATDSIIVDILPQPIINLGEDILVCDGDTILLDVTTVNATYLWQDNSTGPTFDVLTSGSYWVTVSTGACSDTDSINVSIGTPPIIDLGSDVTLCSGETISLNATTLNGQYNWQDTSTDSTFLVSEEGIYWVEVTVDNCSSVDSIVVGYYPSFNLSNDTTICEGDNILLDVSTNNASYLWQDNSTASTFLATEPGIYWVQINTDNCAIIDTIQVLLGTPPEDQEYDFQLCEGTYIEASQIPADLQVFYEGQNILDILFSDSISVQIQISNDQCSIYDTLHVDVIKSVDIDLGDNLNICFGDNVTLKTGIFDHIVTWQDGTEAEEFNITQPGLYSASVTYACGLVSDSLNVEFIDCDTTIFIPNAFTPDEDGVNDLFKVRGIGISYFEIKIFDRWGKVVFQNDDIDLAWNGGTPGSKYYVPDGVYYYEVEYAFGLEGVTDSNPDRKKSGFITVVR